MSMTWSLTKLCLVGVTVGHPGLHMTMHAIVYEAVTALCAVEWAVEISRCRALYRGNTSDAHRPAFSVEQYSNTTLQHIQLCSALQYTALYTPPMEF